MSSTRSMFGGHWYYRFQGFSFTKNEATQRARQLRSEGWKVRVTPSGKRFILWTRKG